MRVPVFQFAWRQGDTHSRFFLSYLVVLGAFVIIGPSSLVLVGHQPLEVGFSMSFAATLSLGFWKTWYPVAYLCLPVVRRILAFPSLSSDRRNSTDSCRHTSRNTACEDVLPACSR